MKIVGLEGLTDQQVDAEIRAGAKFVVYMYTISVLVMTFRRGSDVHFIRAGESAVTRGLFYTALTLLLGWWGIPWGPIYSIQSLVTNLGGGKDVTDEMLGAAKRSALAA